MRRIAPTNKKVRGIPRRLRSLAAWSRGFTGRFPAGLREEDRYCNYKIPVLQSLVEGKQTTRGIQRECAQRLIDACGLLMASKPPYAAGFRVVATICLPDLYTSEICIYTDDAYFRSQIATGSSDGTNSRRIEGRRLSEDWGLELAEGIQELGIALDHRDGPDSDDGFTGERWFFGEVP